MIADGRIAAFHIVVGERSGILSLLRHDGLRRVMTMGEVTADAKQTLGQLLENSSTAQLYLELWGGSGYLCANESNGRTQGSQIGTRPVSNPATNFKGH